jgi:hypothetical protein
MAGRTGLDPGPGTFGVDARGPRRGCVPVLVDQPTGRTNDFIGHGRRIQFGRFRGRSQGSGAGLLGWSLLGFLLAALGLSDPGFLRIISLLFFAGMAVWTLRKQGPARPDFASVWKRRIATVKDLPRVPALLLALVFFFYGAATVLPETFADALHYYLAVPQAYLRTGRMLDIPGYVTSYYPGFVQTLFLWGLAWGDDRLCRLLNLSVGILWAGALYAWLRARRGVQAAAWAALFLAASPFVGQFMWSCTYEMVCGFFLFLAFGVWTRALNESFAPERRRLFFLAGLFLGAAGAAKYTAAFALPYFGISYILGRRADRQEIFWFLCGGALPWLPWGIRNWVFAGNPFYPYSAAGTDISALQKDLLERFAASQQGETAWGKRFLTVAVQSTAGIWHNRNAYIGPVFLMLLPFAGFARRGTAAGHGKLGRGVLWPLGLYAAKSYAAFSAATGFLRFFIPHLWVLAALAGIILAALLEKAGRFAKSVAALMGSVVAVQLASVVLIFVLYYEGLPVVFGRMSGPEYLRSPRAFTYMNPPDRAYDFLRARGTSPQDKVYVLGETRVFRSPGEPYGNWRYDVPLYAAWFAAHGTMDGFLDHLRGRGFRYIILNWPEFTSSVLPEFQALEWKDRLNSVLRQTRSLYRDTWTLVYEIPGSGLPDRTGAVPPLDTKKI